MAFQTLLSVYDFFPKKERMATILPVLITDILTTTPPYLLPTLASSFGRLVFKMSSASDFTPENLPTFQACYQRMSRSDDAEIRLACAHNFPAVVMSFGANQYSASLDELLQAFTQDKEEGVRVKIAAGLHEVAHLLGQQRALRYIKSVSLQLLRDESAIVQSSMISKLPDIMVYFCTGVDDEQKV